MAVAFEPQARWWSWVNGERSALLPDWVSYRVQFPRTGVGGFDVVYPLNGQGAGVLTGDVFSALSIELMDPDGVWSEPVNGRFLPLRRSVDYDAGTVTVSGASLGWLLGKAVRWFQPSDETPEGKREFVNASAGTILQWHYYWAVLRGAISGLFIDFDGFADSDAVAWADRFDVEYERGVTLRAIWDGFEADGLVWRVAGDVIQVAQGRFADVPADAATLWAGRDCAVDRIEVSLEGAAGSVMATGQGTEVGAAQLPNFGPWGRWEVAVSHQGATTATTCARLARVELASRGLSRSGATVTLLPTSDYRPMDNLMPGQPVRVRVDADTRQVFRWGVSRWGSGDVWGSGTTWSQEIAGDVEEIVIADDGTHADVSLSVGDRSEGALELVARQVRGVTGGRVVRRAVTGVA